MSVLAKELMNPAVRLLIVDDETHIRSVIARALSLTGYNVEEAASGDEALALLEHSSYDLMLLDMVMPGIKGTDVLRKVYELKPEMSVIVLTGHATLENAIVALKCAAADFLLKPTSIHEIIEAITRALQKRTARAQIDYLDDVLGDRMDKIHYSETSSILSRFSGHNGSRFVNAHPWQLDRSKRIVEFVEGSLKPIPLSRGETAVLGSLMESPGLVLSCQQLAKESWGYKLDQDEAESVIRPYIFRLRSKIETNPKKPSLIRTIRRRGYQFMAGNQ